MPTFDSAEPVSALIQMSVGTVRVHAAERGDTVVRVLPSDPSNDTDVQAAEQTRVDYSGGRLVIKQPQNKSWLTWFGWGGSIDLVVDLPSGSRLEIEGSGEVRAEGRLGECRITASMGDVWLEETGKLQLKTSHGDITVNRTAGHTDVTSANGEIHIREIEGTAAIRTSNGNITIGRVAGEARLNTAHGEIAVDRALAGVGAKTASGEIRIGEVSSGTVHLETGYGDLELGVRSGTAAWLDVSSQYGDVRVGLDDATGPGDADGTVEIRARTGYGDILIRRA